MNQIRCDGCRRSPSLWEWFRAEMTHGGYEEWRHPGISFEAAGCQFTVNNRDQCERLFEDLFQRPLPAQGGYLCPTCQEKVGADMPELLERDRAGEEERQREKEEKRRAQRQEYLGVQRPWD